MVGSRCALGVAAAGMVTPPMSGGSLLLAGDLVLALLPTIGELVTLIFSGDISDD